MEASTCEPTMPHQTSISIMFLIVPVTSFLVLRLLNVSPKSLVRGKYLMCRVLESSNLTGTLPEAWGQLSQVLISD